MDCAATLARQLKIVFLDLRISSSSRPREGVPKLATSAAIPAPLVAKTLAGTER